MLSLSPAGLTVRVALSIYNPNSADLVVDSLTANVEVAGHFVGTYEKGAEDWRLSANQHTDLVAEFLVPFHAAPSILGAALFEGQVPYRVQGDVSLTGLPFEVPYEIEGAVQRSVLLRSLKTGEPGL